MNSTQNDLNSYLADLRLTTPVKQRGEKNYTSDYASTETTPEKVIKQSKQHNNQQPNGGAESKTNLIVNYLPQVFLI